MAFDSVQVRFKDIAHIESPFPNTRVVPFVGSYLEVLKSVVHDINTEYFWFFSNFVELKQNFDINYIPEQHEKDQIHVWYATHPKVGLNKEGNVFLIPTKEFKKQVMDLKYLRDYKEINYHPDPILFQRPIGTTVFKLTDPVRAYNRHLKYFTNGC